MSNSTQPQPSDQQRALDCFLHWMEVQARELTEFTQALSDHSQNDPASNRIFSDLVDKAIHNFQEYVEKRSSLAPVNVSPYFAPSWCTSLENSMLWIAGCRPSLSIRLVYAICGSEIESQMASFLEGSDTSLMVTDAGNRLGELSSQQLVMLKDLHIKVLKEEERLTNRLASLQEEVADQPIAVIARRVREFADTSQELNRALDNHAQAMTGIMKEADELRLSTLKELMSILRPRQGVDLVAAGKKLHLCLHAWGKGRDRSHQEDGSGSASYRPHEQS